MSGKETQQINQQVEDSFVYSIMSIEEALRQHSSKPLTMHETAIPSKTVIIQGNKGLRLIDVDKHYEDYKLVPSE
jgi:hypothetical protein